MEHTDDVAAGDGVILRLLGSVLMQTPCPGCGGWGTLAAEFRPALAPQLSPLIKSLLESGLVRYEAVPDEDLPRGPHMIYGPRVEPRTERRAEPRPERELWVSCTSAGCSVETQAHW